jgi:hypothetical protein
MSAWRFITCSVVMVAVSVYGCERREASRADCEVIFERLITLELSEMGYRDPALTQRWIKRLRARYRAELDECVGRELPPGALQCLQEAKTAEVVSHDCLR